MSWGLFGTESAARINWDRMRRERKERALKAIRDAKLGAFLAMYEENIRYITGVRGQPWTRDKPGLRYALLTSDGFAILYEQGDIWKHSHRNAPWLDKVKYSYGVWIKGASGPATQEQAEKFANDIKKEMKEHGVADMPLGTDFIDFNMLRAFEKVGIEVVDGLGVIHEARAVKTQDEIEAERMVAILADAIHYEATKVLRPGVSENGVMAHLYKVAYSIPNVDHVETIIVSSGPHSWPNYRNFTDRIIEYGDLVVIDVVIAWNGYHSCHYRTYSIGRQPTKEQKDVYYMALDWLNSAIKAVRPGVTTRDIAEKFPSAMEVWGYREEEEAAANLWGHGLGLSHYDLPLVSRITSLKYPYPIKENMVFALETQHGKEFEWGVRIERMLRVTSSGVEMLDKFPVDEIITVPL
ncbi:MAG TPA: Xaa-Pro peptidase family protein [Sulfolobales archaeon]|nr:Xaa-Pro peptidase family protein [Sulfolobales archaeon]